MLASLPSVFAAYVVDRLIGPNAKHVVLGRSPSLWRRRGRVNELGADLPRTPPPETDDVPSYAGSRKAPSCRFHGRRGGRGVRAHVRQLGRWEPEVMPPNRTLWVGPELVLSGPIGVGHRKRTRR